MSRRVALTLSCLGCLVASRAAFAEGDGAPSAAVPEIEIHLLTMGPGDHLYTRSGHAALMVAEMQDGRPTNTKVYNFGDTDWERETFVSDFLRGRLIFFLSSPGDLTETVMLYGVEQSRDVYRQKLNLTSDQARQVARRLEVGLRPENREYLYHHLEAICTTKIRDLLDEVTGGALTAQLGPRTDAHTVRHYVDWAFSGWWGASLGSALLLGRMHDEPISEYYVLFQPRRMRELFQEVTLELANGEHVPLADPPTILAERQGPQAITGPNRFPTVLAWIFLLVAGVGAFAVYGHLPGKSRPAGVWLLLWSIPSGLIGLVIAFLMAVSDVPEARANELIVAFPPTDLFLVIPAYRWLRGRTYAGPLMRIYAGVRVSALVLISIGRIAGELYQQPVIWFWVGLVCVFALWSMVRGMRVTMHHKGCKRGPQKSTYLAYILGNLLVRLLGWRVDGRFPADVPKAVVIAAPHTSNWD
ncbi:MAG: DUF4105 domain-containing protein, partial [Myxococcota bacterium]